MRKPQIYIEDFEMPKTCAKCPFVKWWDADYSSSCKATKRLMWNNTPDKTRHKNCPLKIH